MTGQVIAIGMRSPSKGELARLALMAVQYKAQVGEVLKRRRKALGLSQPQVASRVEDWLREHKGRAPGKPFSPQNVSRWERGANLGKTDNLEAVAAALETTVADLMSELHEKPAETPNLLGALNGDAPNADLQEQLDRIEAHLAEQDEKLTNALEFLAYISAAVRRGEDSSSSEAAA